MTAPYIRRPWRSQPPGMAVVDPDSILYPGIESVFLGSLTAGEVNGVTTTQVPNLAASNSWGGNGVPIASSTAYGFGPLLASTIYYSIGAGTTSPWTLAAIIQPVGAVLASVDWIGVAQSAGSGTHDRSISTFSNGHWAGYLYDSNAEYADSGITPVVGRPDLIVVWTTGSVLGINVNGTEATKTVISTGAGYSGSLFLSDGTNNPANSFICPLCIRSLIAWDANQRSAFINNPWQVFTPQVRRTWIQGPAAAPYLPFQWWHDAGGGSMGAVLAQ